MNIHNMTNMAAAANSRAMNKTNAVSHLRAMEKYITHEVETKIIVAPVARKKLSRNFSNGTIEQPLFCKLAG